MVIRREWEDGEFSIRDVRIAALLHEEMGRIIDSARLADRKHDDLPPRLRQTLELMMTGLSEKAGQLELSTHTVHDFVKRLYQILGVHSKGELIARHSARGKPPLNLRAPPPFLPPPV